MNISGPLPRGRVRISDMPDDPTKRGEADSIRVNIHEGHEIRYWTEALIVSPEELKAAVKKVGPMADDVRKELQK